jgi:cobaltochelatase CobS
MDRTRIEVPLDRFGFTGVPMTVPGFAETHELVPQIDPGYVFEKLPFQILRAWWMSATREPLYIHGPWGCGKTSSVEQFLARLNVPVVPIMGRDPMEKADLMGMYVLAEDRRMAWVDGPAALAWRHGYVLLVNEFSKCNPGFWVANNELLEGKPIFIEQRQELLRPHPDTRVVVTDNTRGLVGDETGLTQGRFRQDASVMDRFWSMTMHYMAAEPEVRLVQARFGELGVEMAERFAQTLRSIADDVRACFMGASKDNDAIEATISTRTMLRIADLVLLFLDGASQGIDPFRLAFEIGLTNKCDETTRHTIHKLVQLHVGNNFVGAQGGSAAP